MPDFTAGTGNFYSISKNLGLPAFLLVEDDIVTNFPIFLTGLIFYNKYTGILSPIVCNNSFWNRKSIKYAGYHELAYLHPNHFTLDKQLVEKYFSTEKPYVIIRFAKLNAYHDIGIKGINTEIAQKLIDILKPHAKEAIAELKKAGIKKTVMLTGDSKRVADQVAKELGIGEVYSELLPADKVSKVEELLHQKSEKEKLAFVGDGINDAPVLSRADIGIAMGALGSDAAIETADVALMDDDLRKIPNFIRLSKKTHQILVQNISLALITKLVFLILTMMNLGTMWMAVFADVGVSLLVVANGLRLLRKV